MKVRGRAYSQYPKDGDPFQGKLPCMNGHYPVLEEKLLTFPKGIMSRFDEALKKTRGYSRYHLKRGNFLVQDTVIIQREFFPNIPIETLFEHQD